VTVLKNVLNLILGFGGRANGIDDPSSDQQARGDPYCTLFVSRLSYETTEHDLEREFGRFGPIERVSSPGKRKD
jgi:RNA recognition motif-containing protein